MLSCSSQLHCELNVFFKHVKRYISDLFFVFSVGIFKMPQDSDNKLRSLRFSWTFLEGLIKRGSEAYRREICLAKLVGLAELEGNLCQKISS